MNIHKLLASHLDICCTFKVEAGRSQSYTLLLLGDPTGSTPRVVCRSQVVHQFVKCVINKEKAMHLSKNLAPKNGSTAPVLERENSKNCYPQRSSKATKGGGWRAFSEWMVKTPTYIYSEVVSLYLSTCMCYTDADIHSGLPV